MKKGSIIDIFYALTILFIISIALLICVLINITMMGAFVTNFQNNTQMNASIQKIQTAMTNTYNEFNYGFLFIYVAMLISISVLDYFVDTHPLFLPLTIIVQIFSVFYSMLLANIYWYFINGSPQIQAIANDFFVMTFIMKNLPFFDVLYIAIIDIVMYMKKR
jgi:hypothetical protein